MAALARYDDLAGRRAAAGVPAEQGAQAAGQGPRAGRAGPKDPDLEWCPPGHGDLYTALRGTGLLDRLIDAGYQRVFVSNSDNLGAVPGRPGRRLVRRAPVRRSRSRRCGVRPRDRKGGHFARRKSDGRIVLRETAQTLAEDQEALADLDRHRFCSTNNLWFDLRAMKRRARRAAAASSGCR